MWAIGGLKAEDFVRAFQNGLDEVCGICTSKGIVQRLFRAESLNVKITVDVSEIKNSGQAIVTFILAYSQKLHCTKNEVFH